MSQTRKIPSVISGAVSMHKAGITGKGVTVAVMDSGYAHHPDIASHRIPVFQDFVHHSKRPSDTYSHGTHVAGIIASSRIGIAPECNIIPLKILDSKGNGSTDIFIEAIKWILSNRKIHNIRIVNISIGGNADELKKEHNRLNLWVNKLWESGLVICCSAGNNGSTPDSITAPGNCKRVITVGSYDGTSFSSAGPLLPYISKPELSAPGYNILSLKPGGGYCIKTGTSMSVPFISGACALLLQKHPELTNDQIKIRIISAAHPLPSLPNNIQGAGAVNLHELLSE